MPSYKNIVDHYEKCFQKYGDNYKGVDWPNQSDLNKRYQVMIELIKEGSQDQTVSLLDFGCGTAMLKEYIDNASLKLPIQYFGLDAGQSFIKHCVAKYPNNTFFYADVLDEPEKLLEFDYVVMNGVFTEKREISFNEMFDYFKKMIEIVFNKCKKGIAFNVMSKSVEWEREDLFHLSTDLLINFLTQKITRNFVIRNDYGLYEYTVYLYK